MSRRPRSTEAASERLTIRFTKTEIETAEALAGRADTDLASFVRQLLVEAARPSNKLAPSTPGFIDARGSSGPIHWNTTMHRPPAFVFTLHHVPGRSEPLCVRRRVLLLDSTFVHFEYARGTRTASFDLDAIEGHETARTRGEAEYDHDGDGDRLGLEANVRVYFDPPTEAEIATWKVANGRWQTIIKARSATVWTCWNGRFQAHQAKPETSDPTAGDGDGPERRGLYRIKLGRLHEVTFDAFDLAAEIVQHLQCLDEAVEGPGKRLSAPFKLWLEKPFADETEAECKVQAEAGRQREADRRIKRECEAFRRKWAEDQAWRERADRTQGFGSFVGSIRPPNDSLELLGISWPCTEEELKTAHRKKVLDHHPDRGGDSAKMASINAARDRIAPFIRPPESWAS